jgi:hypothetical protein
MPSFACLRVELPDEVAKQLESLQGHLKKIVEAYLETRWSWPRQISHLEGLTFLLTDPRISEFDSAELVGLADQLQRHLFAESRQGKVIVLLFSGPEEAVNAFAAYSSEEVAAALAEPERLPPGGQLVRVLPADDPAQSHAPETPTAPPGPVAMAEHHPRLAGVYLLTHEVFVADVLAIAPSDAPHHLSVIEDLSVLPPSPAQFDAACFRAAGAALGAAGSGRQLWTPVSYSHFVRPGRSQQLQAALALLPAAGRSRMVATLYAVPPYLAVGPAQLLATLDPHFHALNLVTADPTFDPEQLPQNSVAALIFCMRERDVQARQAAMRAFAARAEACRRRGVRQVLANVRTSAELELARRLDLQLVCGPAVCAALEQPAAGRAVPLAQLPLRG